MIPLWKIEVVKNVIWNQCSTRRIPKKTNLVCLDLPGVVVIADDHSVSGHGNTMEEACKSHDNNLRGLLERARKIGLQFNSAKMRLRHEEVRYLGHLISGDCLKPDHEKVGTIVKMEKPTDIKALQQFIGFVNYLAKFLPKFSTIYEPLCKLSGKDAS